MADVKLHWKVDPSPVGRYRSFEKRSWPTAYYGKEGKPAAFIRCEDAYRPAEAKSGEHGELTIDIAHHQHPKAGKSWTLMRLARRAKTLDEAKSMVAEFVARHPEVHPLPPKVTEEVPLEEEVSIALLELLEILAFRKAGGSQLVINMEEPKIIAKVQKALARAGFFTEEEVLTAVRNAEAKARDKK